MCALIAGNVLVLRCVSFVSARADREAECCQISLTEHVPMGLYVT